MLGAVLGVAAVARAQEPEGPAPVHEHVSVGAQALTPPGEVAGSGWLPATTPMFGLHRPWRAWDLRFDGSALAQLAAEPGDRHRTGGASARQVSGLSWGMVAARRALSGGRFGVRAMVSAEPWTVSRCGTISFLSTGEVCEGDTIHDRQQPHDLVMELAADYDHPFRGRWSFQLYAGVAGEPALGPPGYPHRPSARANPMPPITHHWLDSTHVTFGLVTLGLHDRRWKTEVSMFNGRSPDEGRVGIDLGRFDSVSARVSFLPADRWAAQVSVGRLRDAWTDFPFPDQAPVIRLTASAVYQRPLATDGLWATTVAVGINRASEQVVASVLDTTTAGVLLESSLTRPGGHVLFGRAEAGGMPAHHLHAHEFPTTIFTVAKIEAGYVRQVGRWRGAAAGVGGAMALSLLPPDLAPRYGGRVAPGGVVFLSVSAARHQM